MKILSVVGARPQFIKAGPVSLELRQRFDEIIVHTGQHYDKNMSDVFFNDLKIPKPNYQLNIGSGSHAYQTGNMMIELEKIFIQEQPDIVLLYGDTNSTLAAGLAAVKLNMPIAHVESGPRNNDINIPEEVNRVTVDRISSINFCATEESVKNLNRENIINNVYLTGDVMFDAFIKSMEIVEEKSSIVDQLKLNKNDYILLTIHRSFNTDDEEKLNNIVNALIQINQIIVFPVHPRTIKKLVEYGLLEKIEKKKNIIITDPLGYFDFILLEKYSKKIVTDSGGVQREAYFAKKPCITLMNNTSWPDTVNDGANYLVGARTKDIVWAINNFNTTDENFKNIFGDGTASAQITNIIHEFLKQNIKVPYKINQI